MSDNSISSFNMRERATASADMLEAAVAELLHLIPETWQAYRPDALGETQAQALLLLTAAGMVERRERLRLAMASHPVVAEATITFTGEYGGVEALESIAARLWDDWRDAYAAWKQGDAANVPPAHCERLEPSEWRLTAEGILARQDLDGGEQGRVFDFVLRRGLFDGQPRAAGDGIFRREAVRGAGALVRLRKSRDEAAATVNLANWGEGADAFAKTFAGLFAMIQPPAALPGQAAPAAPKGKGKENLRTWTQEDLDNAILEYKARRADQYKNLVEGIRGDPKLGIRPSPAAKKAAREVYGRNAIARALGVKSPSMVSKSPAWMTIANELGLELRRGRARGTRHTARPGKIGHEIALERKSATPAPGAINAPADDAWESAERQETIRQINRLARSGRTAKQKADNQRSAEELVRRLQCEEYTDDQVRQIVAIKLSRDK
jgi:hypothetical protein